MMVDAGAKRKGPPTFQHFPINRAKKLKQSWVKTAKIKSKWKAEKRRLASGVGFAGRGDDRVGLEDKEGDAVEKSKEEEEEERTGTPPLPQQSIIHPSRANRHPELEPEINSRRKVDTNTATSPASSLRDLTREAYSRSSLHSYKSDPLNRRRGPGRGSQRGRGRGQPNMRLRMDATLEKIKRDFT